MKALIFLHHVREQSKNLKPLPKLPMRTFILKKQCSPDNNAFAYLNSSLSQQESPPVSPAKNGALESSVNSNKSQQSESKVMRTTQNFTRFKIQRKSTETYESCPKPQVGSPTGNFGGKINKNYFSSWKLSFEISSPKEIPLFRNTLVKQSSRCSLQVRPSESEQDEIITSRNGSLSPVGKSTGFQGQKPLFDFQFPSKEEPVLSQTLPKIVNTNGNFTTLSKIWSSQIMKKRNGEAEGEDKLPSIHKVSKFKIPKK